MVLQGLSQIGWQLALFISAVELNLDAVVAVLQTVAVPAVLEEKADLAEVGGQERALHVGYDLDLLGRQVEPTYLVELLHKGGPTEFNTGNMMFVTIEIQGDHSPCAKPPVDYETKVPFWPGLT